MKAANDNYYDVLGLASFATADDIKKAYRNLAKKYHPDKVVEKITIDEHHAFIGIQQAYAILSNPKKRKIYDLQLHNILPMNDSSNKEVIDSKSLLNGLERLSHKIPLIDVFRSDIQLLEKDILHFLQPQYLTLIHNEDEGYKVKFLLHLSFAWQPLSYKSKKQIIALIQATNYFTAAQMQPLFASLEQAKKIAIWDTYKYGLIVLLTILLCLSIYFLIA